MPSNLSKEDAELYKQYGIEPPETVRHMSDDQMETVADKIRSQAVHVWNQGGRDSSGKEHGGNDTWCSSCTHVHGFLARPGDVLTGTDDGGNPIFRNIDTR